MTVTIKQLCEAFDLKSDGGLTPEQLFKAVATFGLRADGGLKPEAMMEVKRRQDNFQDQIARDIFAVLYGAEFAKYWFDTHATDNGSRGFHYGEVCRAARAASDIALHATDQIMHEDDELDARQNLLRKFIAELEDAEDD